MSVDHSKLKQDFITAERSRSTGVEAFCDATLAMDPNLLQQMHDVLLAAESEGYVSERFRHLLWVAVDSVVSHLFATGAETHLALAIKHGASTAEIVETLQIASSVSSRGYEAGLPIVLAAVDRQQGRSGDRTTPLNHEQVALKQLGLKRLGYWPDWMELAIRADPEFLQTYLDMGYPESRGDGFSAKDRELVFFAAYACPAVVDPVGMKRHAERALELGSCEGELLQVLRLANCISLHSAMLGIRNYTTIKTQVAEPALAA